MLSCNWQRSKETISSKDARPNKKLTSPVQLTILHTVLQHPEMYLHELQEIVCVLTGVHVSKSSLCTFLKGMNFTRQKMQIVAKQRDDDLREQFFADVSLYKQDMLIFIDESGSDNRDTLRKYGYSIRGKPPRSLKLLVRGERVSVIAALSNDGVETLRVVRGTGDGDTFLEFVERELLPVLQPFNGMNPNSVVIMDNCSVHHVARVKSLISEVGALLHYLPPYSPDLNPIEKCFSKVKSCLKSTEIVNDDLETAVLAAFTCVTPNDCEGWIRDSKVYTSN